MTRLLSRRRTLVLGAFSAAAILGGCGTGPTRAGLYVAELDGAPRWIEDTTGASAWSPDAEALAWGDDRGLRMLNSATGDVSLLTAIPMVGRPAWSPSGSAIAFMDSQARVLQSIEIASGVTTPLATLSGGTGGAIPDPIVTRGGPAWSPDASRIAFICWDGYGDELCIVDSAGIARQQVTTLGGALAKTGDLARSSVTSMAWSPDGSALAVAVQTEEQGATSGVFRVELDVRSGRRLTKITANAPLIWDAASDDLILSARVEGRGDVYRLPAEGGKPYVMTSGLPEGAREPTLAGDGTLGAVSGSRIAIVYPTSAEVTYIEETGLACASPALSADGQRLAFLALPRPIQGYP